MKEITFLKQNAKKWEGYGERISGGRPPDPATLTNMFIEVTDDLSYSRTNYSESNTTTYLNGLASQVHQLVYRNKKENRGTFRRFFAVEAPMAMGRNLKQLLYSFCVTAIAVLIGVCSQALDEDFVRVILGDRYVDETIQRIKEGQPLGVYAEQNQLLMFVSITINNIRVALLAFVSGLFAVAGTAALLLYNGIMLGAFFAMFARYGLIGESLRVVFIHGTLEISAIVIAGAAGFMLGRSILFPGTYTRRQSLMKQGREATRIMMALVPVFIAAGFLESFVTRYTGMPLTLSLLIIFGSLAFIVYYFLVYPLRLVRRGETA